MNWIEQKVNSYLDHFHGHGDDHQLRYYRCEGCRQLVTWKKIKQGGCPCGLSSRVRPAIMKFREKVKCLITPFWV